VWFCYGHRQSAIIGFGTIGSGVARLLLEHGDRIARQAGKRLN